MLSKFGELDLPVQEMQSEGETVYIVPHAALEDVLLNHEQVQNQRPIVNSTQLITHDPGHYAFLCSIVDNNGYRVECIGEATPATLTTPISRNYPVLMAHKRAFDGAVIRYLGLQGKVYSDQQIVLSSPDMRTSSNAPQYQMPSAQQPPVQQPSAQQPTWNSEYYSKTGKQPVYSSMQNTSWNTVPQNGQTGEWGAPVAAAAQNRPPVQQPPVTQPSNISFPNSEGGPLLTVGVPYPMPIDVAFQQYPDAVYWAAQNMNIHSDEEAEAQRLCRAFLAQIGGNN